MSYDANLQSYENEIARLLRDKATLVEALDFAEASLDEIGNPLVKMHLSALIQKARSATELPSVNWKDGKAYGYCPECGRQEPSGLS